VPLPVSLTRFEGLAKQQTNLISWETSMEMNNRHFELEYSSMGSVFTPLAKVATMAENGQSTTPLVYSFEHTKPAVGHNYYRLTQVDIDGQMQRISEVIDVQRRGTDQVCILYPNPGTNQFSVQWEAQNEQVRILMYDVSGRLVYSKEQRVTPGRQTINTQVHDVADGLYTIQVIDGEERVGIFRWKKTQP
jgi:hypothetical protein